MITERWLYGLLPPLALALFAGAFLLLDPLQWMDINPPPAEALSIERVDIRTPGFAVLVRNSSAQPVQLAQVMVDGAYWVFSQDPGGLLDRLETAWVRIDYPWVAGETHHLRFITKLGATFDHTVDVALETPQPSFSLLLNYALLGIVVGLIPVAFGMLFYPAMKSLGLAGLEFILAVSLGLLGYLFVDMTLEGLELAGTASALFGGPTLVVIPLVLTLSALLAFGNRTQTEPDGLRVALLIAFGIGLHNFGEGLAIGASFAANKLAVGALLVVGFTLHNTTEGIAVVSPLARERVALPVLGGLALLAGLPTVPGIWIGAFSLSAHWAAVFFGVGAGAVLQVMIEIDRFVGSSVRTGANRSRFSATSVAGYCAGIALMYGTALLVTI